MFNKKVFSPVSVSFLSDFELEKLGLGLELYLMDDEY